MGSDAHDLILSLSELGYNVLECGTTFFHNLDEPDLDFCAISRFDVVDGSLEKSKFPVLGGLLRIFFSIFSAPERYEPFTTVPIR